MKRLRNMGLINILERNVINKKKYILGICVGMQILGNSSEEGKESGIGWINGKIEKIKLKHDAIPNLPHMGWNSISCNGLHPLIDKLDLNLGFYFLHSYHFNCQNNSNELASFSYHSKYSAVVGSKNVLGVQFHPEKSHTNGKILLKNFSIL